jgi:hypothetical protein
MNAFQFGSSLLNKKADNFRGFQPPKPGTPFRIVDRSASDPKNDVPSWNDLPGNRPSPQLPAAKSPPMTPVPQQKQPPMVSIPQRAATGGAYPPISPAGSNNNAASPMASYDPPMPASTSRRFAPALTLENILPGSGMSPVRKAIEGATSGVVADSPQGSMWNQLRSDIGSAGLNKSGSLKYKHDRNITMNALQFGYRVKLAMGKSAATAAEMLAPYGTDNPGSLYPFSPDVAKNPEYAPRTPPQTFRGTKVEADIPPRMFPKTDQDDVYPDLDDVDSVYRRTQLGQGLLNSWVGHGINDTPAERQKQINAMNAGSTALHAQNKSWAAATGAPSAQRNSNSKIFPDMPPELPEGAPRPPVAQPPRGLGSAARR